MNQMLLSGPSLPLRANTVYITQAIIAIICSAKQVSVDRIQYSSITSSKYKIEGFQYSSIITSSKARMTHQKQLEKHQS